MRNVYIVFILSLSSFLTLDNDNNKQGAIFAKVFGESLSAIEHWEQGRRNMPKPARRLLDIVEKDPGAVFGFITEKASYGFHNYEVSIQIHA